MMMTMVILMLLLMLLLMAIAGQNFERWSDTDVNEWIATGWPPGLVDQVSKSEFDCPQIARQRYWKMLVSSTTWETPINVPQVENQKKKSADASHSPVKLSQGLTLHGRGPIGIAQVDDWKPGPFATHQVYPGFPSEHESRITITSRERKSSPKILDRAFVPPNPM